MLLSRDELGEPVVSEHWTVVMTDPDDGGATPTQIYARFRCTYTFYSEIPSELGTSTGAFSRDVDAVTLPPSGMDVSDADG